MKKFLIILMQILLIVQFINAIPTNSETDNLRGEDKLIFTAHNTYVDFFTYASEKYSELFKDVIKDAEPVADKDENLKNELKPFEDFVARAVNLKSSSKTKLQDLFNECTNLADKYDKGVPPSASEADHQLAQFMETAHAIKTKFDILIKFMASLQQFGNDVRKYLNSLSEEELKTNKKLQRWYQKWQFEDDLDKKSDLMIEFFDLYDTPKTDYEKMLVPVMKSIFVYLNKVVDARKDVYKRLEQAIGKEFPDPNESIQFQENIFKGYADRAGKVHELKGMDAISELMRLYAAGQEISTKYGGNDLNEDEKKVAKLLEGNGNMQLEVQITLLTFELNDKVIRNVEEYLNLLSKEEKDKEAKLAKWFEDVQDETDYTKKSDKLLEVIENLKL